VNVDLATASYRSFVPAMGVAIATSLGRPKWPLHYELSEEVRALMPSGLFGKDLSDAEFAARYRERLDKTGVAKLQRVFHAISAKHGGARLVCLCFEDVLGREQLCHRRTFADWWQERTGQPVPELSWVRGPDGVPVVVRAAGDDPTAMKGEDPDVDPGAVRAPGAHPVQGRPVDLDRLRGAPARRA